MVRTLSASMATLAAVALLVGCSSAEPAPAELSSAIRIIDVRTPAEFDGGHLEGSVNIDVQSDTFEGALKELPLDGEYLVYCASGNRSAVAVERMTELGFESITDAGGVSEATAATGIDIVTD